jgi:hypothetical protein
MPKRNPALPQEWPGQKITHAEVEEILVVLKDPRGATAIGERLAIALLEHSPSELKKRLDKLGNEVGNTLVDALMAAEGSLKARSGLVMMALARVACASGAVKWPESKGATEA